MSFYIAAPGANAQSSIIPACVQFGPEKPPSSSIDQIVQRLRQERVERTVADGLQQDVVLQGNELSGKADNNDIGVAAQTANDIRALDSALAQRSDDLWSQFAPSERIRLRLTLSKLYFRFGCRSEAATLLESSITLTEPTSLRRAQILTNLGVLQAELDQLPAASKSLGEALKLVPASKDLETAKTRLGLLSALARLARKRGDRQNALEYYRQVVAELADAKVKDYFASSDALAEYESIDATTTINRGILLGYEQRAKEAFPLFENTYKRLRGRPDAVALGLADLLIAWSDNFLDLGMPEEAAKRLDEAIALLEKGGRPELLARALQKRAAISANRSEGKAAADFLRQLDQIRGLRLTPLERAKILSTKAEMSANAGDPKMALEFYKQALDESRKSVPEASIEIAIVLSQLAFAKGKLGDIDGALEDARSADAALTGWLSEEAAGCRAGTAANPGLVATIREARGLFAILKRKELQKIAGASAEEYRKIDRDIFDLVQEREFDRVGVAAERSILRRTNRQTLEGYQQALAELCAAREVFDDAIRSNRPDLAASLSRLSHARDKFAENSKSINSDLRLRFATGNLKLALEDLPNILRDQEAIVAFRVGTKFSLIFIAARRGSNIVTASALSPTATHDAVANAVKSLISAARSGSAKTELPSAVQQLSAALQLGPMKEVFNGITHTFVVADGGLQRLPAHLLPIGNRTLGELMPTSALSSLSMLATLRNPTDANPTLTSFAGFGAPILDDTGCPKPQTSPQTELVQCLGPADGTELLLNSAFSLFGGTPPVTGQAATVAALRKADFTKTGILVLATHGLVGGDKTSPLPAIVLTPDPSDAGDVGLFTTEDISGMALDSVWLAVIAACETASSAPDSVEEGLSGLGLAFVKAGAKALILSYWKAEPSGTRILLERTFQIIKESPAVGVSAALALAMQELEKAGKTPEQWAPFVVIGDGTVKPLERR